MASETSEHLQVYIDGKLVYDVHALGVDIREQGHRVDNGDVVPLKAVLTARLSRCPSGHDESGEVCC